MSDEVDEVDFLLSMRTLAFGNQSETVEVRREWLQRIIELAERSQPTGPYPLKPGDDQYGGGRDSPFRR